MRVPGENRIRDEQRETLRAESLQAPAVLSATSEHEKGTAKKAVSSLY